LMPLKPPTPPPKDQRAWDQWARAVDILPDDGSVDTDQIVDGAVTNDKLRNSAAVSVIGNPGASPATPQDIAASADGYYLRRSAGGLAFGAITDADIPSTIARDTEVTAAITAHEGLSDPHPVYLTQTEGDARYLELTDSANPSASLGLTAVNGSATTYMRSDGAPALSQAITPTWTSSHTFSRVAGTSTWPIYIASNTPGFVISESDGAADNKKWNFYASGESLSFRVMNDAENSDTAWLTVERTAGTVDSISFTATSVLVPGTGAGSFKVGSTPSITDRVASMRATGARSTLWLEGSSSGDQILDVHNSATSGDNRLMFFFTETSPTARGSIDYNRAGAAVRYNTTSDARLKTNIEDAPSALGILDAIKVRQFDWKEAGTDHVSHGFIAQELHEVVPAAVSVGDTWQVDNSKLVPILIKALQEALQRIAVLENK
jgi:hypothetical protein